jgi:hypothetical protein
VVFGTDYDVEAWTFDAPAPLWKRRGCAGIPDFASDGASVTCRLPGDTEAALSLDATSGEVLGVNQQVPFFREVSPRPCIGVSIRAEPTLWMRGTPIAKLLDLGPSQWAIVLPDGRFTGSPGATNDLAFYSLGGALLPRHEIEKLRDPRAVRKVLAALPGDVAGCMAHESGAPARPSDSDVATPLDTSPSLSMSRP